MSFKYRWLAVVALFGCGEPPKLQQATSNLNGTEGMFDFAIDLPWRMEPRIDAQGFARYDRVPITIAILDEDTNIFSQNIDPSSPSVQMIDRFCSLTVNRVDLDGHRTQITQFTPEQLAWIEVTGPGDATHTSYWDHNNPVDPIHRVCHPGAENCSSLERILGTSEWHAQAMLDFGNGLPGARQVLELVARVSQYGDDCSHPIALRNYAELFFGDAPLPRFDDGWLYGDLHYHSQSTDNEGESGYAYRAVATSLAAMGVDFTFATDHASDSRQMVDLDAYGQEEFRGLRDLSQPRWDASQRYMHDAGGANTEGALLAAGRPRLPRIFLGAEVDVMPEIAVRPTTDPPGAAWLVPYGNGLNYNMGDDDGLCEGWVISCPFQELFTPFVDIHGNTAFAVRDTQGLDEHAIGRQHMLHLPRFRDQPTGFVGSRTTKYGGASRHALENNGVLDEIDSKHGIAFLAHPLTNGGGGKGPGFLPYTQYQYEKLFAHHALSGLQLWNEDTRVFSNDGDFGQSGYSYMTPVLSDGNLAPGFAAHNFEHRPVRDIAAWAWTGERTPASSLHHGTAQWDKLLRWGLDLDRTNAINWLPQGEPRRLFMAGGSDAHGDLNYRREGYLFEPKEVNDTALAKVRNLVEVGPVRGPCSAVNPKCGPIDPLAPGHSQDQIVEALGEGHFAVTDGPALRIVIDRNNNHEIDAADTPMGSIVEIFPGEYLPLLVEATSTAEFGKLDKIDLYVGVDLDPATCGDNCSVPADLRSRTYAPLDHGVRTPANPQATDCGDGICKMADGYWLPANGNRQRLHNEHIDSFHTVWKLGLEPAWFPPETSRPTAPTRLYIRAFASTTPPCEAHSPTGNFRLGCAARYAYTNPIWALRRTVTPGQECPYSDRALDNDLDGIPNFCDQFPNQAGGGWTRLFGGQQLDSGTASAIDAFGNVYAVGGVQGNSVRFEGATGTLGSLAAAGTDGVLLKYAPNGQLVQRAVLAGLGMQQVRDIAITNNAIYITGIHQQTTTIGGSTVNPASLDVFIARINTTNLSVDWVKYIDGSGDAIVRGIAANDSGLVAVVGDFTGVVIPYLQAYPAQGTGDCFVAWVVPATGAVNVQLVDGGGGCTARDIVMDPNGRTTVALTHDGTLRISTAITRTTAGTDTAIVRYGNSTESFAPVWATYLGSSFAPGDASALALALSGTNVLVGGGFTGRLDATGTQWGGTTSTIAMAQGGTDGFVVQLDNTGRLLTSPLPTVPGTGDESITAIAVDTTGRTIVTGQFTSTSTSLNNVVLTREGLYQNSFIAWITPAGQVQQSRRISTTGGLVTWGKMTATPTGDRAAIAFTFAGTGRFDDLRAVTALGNSDGAVTVQEGPP